MFSVGFILSSIHTKGQYRGKNKDSKCAVCILEEEVMRGVTIVEKSPNEQTYVASQPHKIFPGQRKNYTTNKNKSKYIQFGVNPSQPIYLTNF